MAVIKKLDFADLREDFKNYLQTQDEFSDYDLTQSGLDVMINLMSYGVHYDSIQANFSNAEMFLSSAQLRKNVTGRAKHLMYTPKSRVAARSIIDFVVEEGDQLTLPGTLFLPKGTKFVTNDSLTESVSFVTTEAYVATRNGNLYTYPNVSIRQGIYTNTTAKYDGVSIEIPNTAVDTSTIEVYVQENPASSTYTRYEKMVDLFDAKGDSKIFYLEENFNEKFEIYFGDGVLGQKVAKGSNVIVTYIVTNGAASNGLTNFSFAKSPNPTDPINSARYSITVRERASGGAERESVESIKFNAPKFFSSNGIILNDYDATNIIPHMFPDIKSVNVWSGKNAGAFGKTYISLNPYTDDLPPQRIEEIIAAVERRRFVVLTSLEHVSPTYIDLGVNLNVFFDGETDINALETSLYAAIVKYSEENIEDFKKKFISSNFIKAIDTDTLDYDFSLSIISRVPIFVNTLEEYDFDFKNEIIEVRTNEFTFQGSQCYIKNTGTTLNIHYTATDNVVKEIGTVDLSTGKGHLNTINVQAILNNTMEFKAMPKRESIFAYDNNILRILESDISISYEVIK